MIPEVDDVLGALAARRTGDTDWRGGRVFSLVYKVPGADGTKPWTDLPAALTQPIELFLDALAGNKQVPLCSATEAAERCAVMERIYQAARTGTRVQV